MREHGVTIGQIVVLVAVLILRVALVEPVAAALLRLRPICLTAVVLDSRLATLIDGFVVSFALVLNDRLVIIHSIQQRLVG